MAAPVIPQGLISSIQSGCSLIVGAGVTINMMDRNTTAQEIQGVTGWTGLLIAGMNQGIRLFNMVNLHLPLDATAAQAAAALAQLVQGVAAFEGDPALRPALEGQVKSHVAWALLSQLQVDLNCLTAQGLRALAPLLRWVATLNFDDFLARVLQRPARAHVPQEPGLVIGNLSQSRAYCYHLHGIAGRANEEAPVLLPLHDYVPTQRAFLEDVRRMQRQTDKGHLLLVGCGPDGLADPHFRALWERMATDAANGDQSQVNILLCHGEGQNIQAAIDNTSPAVAHWAQQNVHLIEYGTEFPHLGPYLLQLAAAFGQ